MPNSAVAWYRPGTVVRLTSTPPDMAMPGIVMFALERTVPTSIREPLAPLNSNV